MDEEYYGKPQADRKKVDQDPAPMLALPAAAVAPTDPVLTDNHLAPPSALLPPRRPRAPPQRQCCLGELVHDYLTQRWKFFNSDFQWQWCSGPRQKCCLRSLGEGTLPVFFFEEIASAGVYIPFTSLDSGMTLEQWGTRGVSAPGVPIESPECDAIPVDPAYDDGDLDTQSCSPVSLDDDIAASERPAPARAPIPVAPPPTRPSALRAAPAGDGTGSGTQPLPLLPEPVPRTTSTLAVATAPAPLDPVPAPLGAAAAKAPGSIDPVPAPAPLDPTPKAAPRSRTRGRGRGRLASRAIPPRRRHRSRSPPPPLRRSSGLSAAISFAPEVQIIGGGAPSTPPILEIPDGICTLCSTDIASATLHGVALDLPCGHRFHEACVVAWKQRSDHPTEMHCPSKCFIRPDDLPVSGPLALTCIICTDPLKCPTAIEDHGEPMFLPCTHQFHENCIKEWTKSSGLPLEQCCPCGCTRPTPPPQENISDDMLDTLVQLELGGQGAPLFFL